jgi:DNA-binding XRE family transcriptional regulator
VKPPDGARIELYASVGRAIREHRTRAGLLGEHVAARIGVGSGTLHGIESGAPCPLHVLVKLADVFDCTLDDLVPVQTR